MKNISIVISTVLLVGCTTSPTKPNLAQAPLASQKVKENSILAIKQCGKGSVKKVDVTSFSCKE